MTPPRFASLAAALAAAVAVPSTAHADELYGEHRGINRIRRGVWEIGVGSLFAFASDRQGDASALRLVTDVNATVSWFVRDNLAAQVVGVVTYNTVGNDRSAITYGGTLGAALHLRLGHGAFLRPALGLGVLAGKREIPVGTTTVMEATQIGFHGRLRLPIGYFINRNLHIEAGPQFNVTAGAFTPEGADAVSFTTIDGGFSVGAGYSF
jgi:hypothetical protein